MHTDLMYMKYYMKSYHVFQYVAQIVGSFFAALIFHISTPKLPEKMPFLFGKGHKIRRFLKKINRKFVCNTNRSAYILRLLSLVGNKLRLDLLCVRGSEN